MTNEISGVSRNSWVAIPQAMQQHGQAKRAAPSEETASRDRAATIEAPNAPAEPKVA